jgi:ATP-dependent Clp protease ATP-binding subunit ClpA
MTVFDEGTLTDAHGRITDFRNTIIVMTTNLGSQNRESIGLVKPAKKDFLSPVKNYFRPEFFNRIDHLVVFNPLDQQTIRNIAIKELNELQQREGFQKMNIKINFTDATTDFIARTGFDKNLGARPLQRAIEQHVTTKLAKHLMQHKRLKNTTLVVDFDDDKIVII